MDRVYAAAGQGEFVIFGFVEAFLHAAEIVGIHRFQADENASRPTCRHQIEEFLILEKVHADLSYPGHQVNSAHSPPKLGGDALA